MSLKRAWGASGLLLALCAATAAAQEPAASCATCGPTGCASGACCAGIRGWFGHGCCPKTCFTLEKPPHLKFKCVCPKPVCDVCSLDGYGYYPTCWRPFAYPPNYEYCPVPPPGALATAPPPLIGGEPGPATPGAKPDEGVPPPKKATPNPNK